MYSTLLSLIFDSSQVSRSLEFLVSSTTLSIFLELSVWMSLRAVWRALKFASTLLNFSVPPLSECFRISFRLSTFEVTAPNFSLISSFREDRVSTRVSLVAALFSDSTALSLSDCSMASSLKSIEPVFTEH